MTVKRSQRLQVVLMLAERKEQEAARHLSEFQQLVDGEKQQLETLIVYKDQYIEQYTRQQNTMASAQMSRYSEFIQHLGGVVSNQRQKLEQLLVQLETVRQHWQTLRYKRRAIDDLVARLAREEDAEAERLLQKMLDDMTPRQRR
ncbi:MAG TPA: flagellar export protein FliJ [Cellvibrionaceae bacterium]